MLRTLFLHPPSYEGFDGGAGSRYQAKREVRSFWYPTWLAQPAALVPGSKLIDAPAAGLELADVLPLVGGYDLVVMHTSSPSFGGDVKVAEELKRRNPALRIGFVGAKVAVDPEGSLLASEAIDFVGREEFDFTIKELAEDRPWAEILGLTYRGPDGEVVKTPDRPVLEDMDQLPYVTEVYKRDLRVEDYYIGYLKHPYVSIYTGRGCRSRCTFCLWPQTVGGHRYRTRSPEHVLGEIRLIRDSFPQVKEIFFDDDTFTDDRRRAEEIARGMGALGVTWSCNAKANVPYDTLKIMRDNGLRLLLVGYESGNQQILINIKKGVRVDRARQFTQDCRDLGITIHGTFIVGLPGETKETIQQTIAYAREINPHSIQVSIAAPYPGTALYEQANREGWLPADDNAQLVDDRGVQSAVLSYPGLSRHEIFDSVDEFYKKFYFRAGKIAEMSAEMLKSPEMMRRRLREGVEFVSFLRKHKEEIPQQRDSQPVTTT
jgi:hopanoid biosynthesis associated radical SAM protein HpnJ